MIFQLKGFTLFYIVRTRRICNNKQPILSKLSLFRFLIENFDGSFGLGSGLAQTGDFSGY